MGPTATIALSLSLRDAGVAVPKAARIQFVEQTSLVLGGIRAGYLVDAFSLPQHKLNPWFRALASRLPESGREIAILHEASSDSVFIVNCTLLLDNLRLGSVPIWVRADDCSIQVS
jgi:hypothetical protein